MASNVIWKVSVMERWNSFQL